MDIFTTPDIDIANENIDTSIEEYNTDDGILLPDLDIKKLIIDAKEEAALIIQQAKKQSKEIIEKEKSNISNWWDEKRAEDCSIIERVKKEGYNEGFSEGKIRAEDEANQQFQSMIKQAKKILEESYIIKEQIIQESELSIIDISIKIAEKIIIKEMEIDKNIIKLITKEALKNINEFDKISIFVNPEHFPFLQTARGDLLDGLNGQVELMIYPDSSIIIGGCIIKTSTGTLDAKIDTQLGEVKQALYDIMGSTSK